MSHEASEKEEARDEEHRKAIAKISKLLIDIVDKKPIKFTINDLLSIEEQELISYGQNIKEYDGLDDYLKVDIYNSAIDILEKTSAAKKLVLLFNTVAYDEEDISANLDRHIIESINLKELDLIQLFTAGKVREKQRQIVFVNHMAESFFMKDEAYLDLLKNQGETRLVKKYNKEKKGYIGGEVLACVTLEETYYHFILVFGSQQQIIIESENVVDKHEYKILKETVEEYRSLLLREKKENEKFIELLSEADHNVRKRFDIDLKACLKDMKLKK